MIKKLVGLVKRLFVKEVQAEELVVEEYVEYEEAEEFGGFSMSRIDFAQRINRLTKSLEKPKPVVEPIRRVVVQPTKPKMSWEQFKAYNNQVNKYLNTNLTSQVPERVAS